MNTNKEKEMEKYQEVMAGINAKRTELRFNDTQALKPWDIHLRENNQTEVEALAQRMREDGYRPEFPIVVDMSTMEVISGVLRLQAAQLAKIGGIPCVCYERLEPIERILIASDDGLKRADKSPMALVKQLDILHNEHGFSYRTIERLFDISKTVIHRKLQVLKLDPAMQKLYTVGQIVDADIEGLLKEVHPEHQEAVAEKIKETGKKVTRKHKDSVIAGYKKAVKERQSQPKAPTAEQKIEIPKIDGAEIEKKRAVAKFETNLKHVTHCLQRENFSWREDVREELVGLEGLHEVVREAIRRRCAKLGIESVVLSRQEEQEIVTDRIAAARALGKPVAVKGWMSDELRKVSEHSLAAPADPIASAPAYARAFAAAPLPVQEHSETDYPKDDAPELLAAYHEEHAPFDESGADLVTERTFQAMGVSPEEKDLLLSVEPPLEVLKEWASDAPAQPSVPDPVSPQSLDASQEPPIHYAEIAPKRFEKAYEKILKRSLGELPDRHEADSDDELDNEENELERSNEAA